MEIKSITRYYKRKITQVKKDFTITGATLYVRTEEDNWNMSYVTNASYNSD